jgi:site-specific recombinase XerD
MISKRNSERGSPAQRRTAATSRARRRRPANKDRRYPAEILTADEVRALIRACSNRAPTGVRNRALLVLLYRAGCRISEALRLLPKDLDRAAGTATVLRGKGGRRRTIGLDPGAFAVVERWLDVRTKLGISSRAPIICTLKGKPVASAYVRALMPRLARRAGIEKRVHAHGLRHTHAAELALEGHPMNLIQAQLGHTSLATTSRYLAHIAPAKAVAEATARTQHLAVQP